MTTLLPPEFAGLEPFAATWGSLTTTDERHARRRASSRAEMQALYDAVVPRLQEIFAHLDRFPLQDLPEREARLFAISLGATEAAQLVEIFWPPPAAAEVASPASMQWLAYP